jgi:hypothetical protein
MSTLISVLLMVKYNGSHITYNELLDATASSYSNLNSARAALSRILRNSSARGLIVRKGNDIWLTEKGTLLLYKDMKNKLLMQISKTITKENPTKALPNLVKNLAALVEQAKRDNELLNVARKSRTFKLNQLRKIARENEEYAKHIQYLVGVLDKQIKTLEELNFYDELFLPATEEAILAITGVCQDGKAKEVLVEADGKLDSQMVEEFNAVRKKEGLCVEKYKLATLLQWLITQHASNTKVLAHDIRITLGGHTIKVAGPFKKLSKLRALAVKPAPKLSTTSRMLPSA